MALAVVGAPAGGRLVAAPPSVLLLKVFLVGVLSRVPLFGRGVAPAGGCCCWAPGRVFCLLPCCRGCCAEGGGVVLDDSASPPSASCLGWCVVRWCVDRHAGVYNTKHTRIKHKILPAHAGFQGKRRQHSAQRDSAAAANTHSHGLASPPAQLHSAHLHLHRTTRDWCEGRWV